MITLTKRLKAEEQQASAGGAGIAKKVPSSGGRISIRDKLLVKEVQEMETTLPPGCKVKFDDPNALHDFTLTIAPDETSHWTGGKFIRSFRVPLWTIWN